MCSNKKGKNEIWASEYTVHLVVLQCHVQALFIEDIWVFFSQRSSMVTLKTWKQGTCTRENQAQILRYDFCHGWLSVTGP